MMNTLRSMIDQFSPLYTRDTRGYTFTINELLRPAQNKESKRAIVANIKEATYKFMQENDIEKFTGPVILGVSIYFSPRDFPAGSMVSLFDSWSGDIDNLLKTLCDGLKGELFLDDILITDIVTKKRICQGVDSHIKIDVIGTEATDTELMSLKVQSFTYEDGLKLSKIVNTELGDDDIYVSATVPVNDEINIVLTGDGLTDNPEAMSKIVTKLNEGYLNEIDSYVCREPVLNSSNQMVVPIKKFF